MVRIVLGILGLRARLFMCSCAYVGPLVLCKIVLTQLPVGICGIVVITVKVPAKHLKQNPSFWGRSSTEALGIRLTHVYSGVNMVYLVNDLL